MIWQDVECSDSVLLVPPSPQLLLHDGARGVLVQVGGRCEDLAVLGGLTVELPFFLHGRGGAERLHRFLPWGKEC